ncbi:DUF6516 family protein [Halorutilales archaeon Cl-col2-1]
MLTDTKIRLHYGTQNGETLLRYDNSHGVFEKHEGEENPVDVDIEYFEAYERFREYVKKNEGVDTLWR